MVLCQNHFAFSPNPWFIAAFFSGQVVLQLAWIRRLFHHQPPRQGYQAIPSKSPKKRIRGPTQPMLNPTTSEEEEHAWKVAVNYAPIYALGNFCIGASLLACCVRIALTP